ncbi:carbohydrate esterase family 4 protein [Collybiopsis luxurians FD-317 M1]|uniref:chitin deacetylase n=1 Tax=Collybiopsis luxurians FD-317 M1 TaxID=944289 RepID=A0A0D0BXK2_9AGAR|nr:carbohydrate esterase family 4 protein [Collybiopsis luxurians FD-317 M1]
MWIFLWFLLFVNASPLDRTTEQGEASITDPDQECAPYSYAPIAQQMSNFPETWQAASILSDDSVALAKWNSISASIPTDIAKKTQPPPSDYPSDDPDCWWTADQCLTPKLNGLPPDVAAAPEPSTLGYGFDDGPNCSHNAFYDFLQSQNQKATFYFIGSNVADFPLEAQRALADGHEICVHTWSHPYMTTFASEDAFAELWYAMQMIKLVVGVTPTCWRPPYGDVDDRIRAIANALGLQTIMWKYDSQDGDINGNTIVPDTVEANYNNFIQTAAQGAFNTTGAIILTHEIDNFTMSEAVKFYPQLKSVFQHIVPVGVSLNKTQPYVETNYSLPTFEEYVAGTLTVDGSRVSNSSTSTSASQSSTSTSTSSTTTPSAKATGESNASANAARGFTELAREHSLLSAIVAFSWLFWTVDFGLFH